MNLVRGVKFVVPGVDAMIYGGPFRKYREGTRRLVGVKMAVEIDHPHEISIPTEDYSVPDVLDLRGGMIEAIQEMRKGKDVYAGCMGGVGRTGLFMACMTKVAMTACPEEYEEDLDPVLYVRSNYNPHAVETQQQMRFVSTFDTSPILKYLQLTAPKAELVHVDKQLGFWGHAKAAFKSLI